MTYSSFAQLADKYKTLHERHAAASDDSPPGRTGKPEVGPEQNDAIPLIKRYTTIDDIYAPFYPELERYE